MPAHRVGRDVERLAEGAQVRADDRFERLAAQVADRVVEEAGTHGAVGLDDHRHPRRVATDGRKRAVAVERGTPLAEVLRAQAQDVREEGRRALMEQGGRKEVLMMVPVVFLILPITVVFAVFPSLVVLRVGL